MNFGTNCKACQSHQGASQGTATVQVLGNCNCTASTGCSAAGAGDGQFKGNLSLTYAEYRDNADCRWIIRSNDGSTVSLWFTRFELEKDNDRVQVRSCQSGFPDGTCTPVANNDFVNGGGNAEPTTRMLYKQSAGGCNWGGHNIQAQSNSYVATSGIFEIHFTSDSTTTYNGFDAFWIVTPKCTDCPSGTCQQCAAGLYRNGNDCLACEAGKYSAFGATYCSICPGNSSSVNGSAASCDGNNSTLCTTCICNAGFTGPHAGNCTACISGTFKSTNGSETCSNCSGSFMASPPGSTNNSACFGRDEVAVSLFWVCLLF